MGTIPFRNARWVQSDSNRPTLALRISPCHTAEMNADELRKRFPWASECFIKANAYSGGICSEEHEPIARMPLVSAASGKEASGDGTTTRYRITFTVFSTKPCDYDNLRTKELQDLLVTAGCLPADNWRVLEGCVLSRKAKSKSEERTIVEIEPLPI